MRAEIAIAGRNKPRSEKESSRWEKLRDRRVCRALQMEHSGPMRVIDEADDFELFSELNAAGLRYVVRVWPWRRTSPDKLPVNSVLAR